MYELYSKKRDQLLKALQKAKSEMGSVKKDSENTFHKSKYASLGSYKDAYEQALENNGFIVTQIPTIENGKSILITTIIHLESDQWMSSYV